MGLEPTTFCMASRRSTTELRPPAPEAPIYASKKGSRLSRRCPGPGTSGWRPGIGLRAAACPGSGQPDSRLPSRPLPGEPRPGTKGRRALRGPFSSSEPEVRGHGRGDTITWPGRRPEPRAAVRLRRRPAGPRPREERQDEESESSWGGPDHDRRGSRARLSGDRHRLPRPETMTLSLDTIANPPACTDGISG